MKDLSAQAVDAQPDNAQVPAYLTEQRRETGPFLWWYRLASPPQPRGADSFQQRELFRRGRTGSQILPALYVLLIASAAMGVMGTNFMLVPIAGIGFIALAISTLFNRLGRVNTAGFIVVATFTIIPMADIVTTPDGLNVATLAAYILLVLPLVCAVSFLPPWWVFVVAVLNSGFTLYSLSVSGTTTNLPQTPELNAFLNLDFAGIVTPILLSQLLVSIIAYVWVQSTIVALARADQAEQIARLEHDLAVQAEIDAQRKQQLEVSIQQIMDTHIRVANGDYSARVSLTQNNVLWQISGSLNNLLARMQRLRHETLELQQAQAALRKTREENEKLVRILQKYQSLERGG